MTALRLIPSPSEPFPGTSELVPVDHAVEVVLGSVQPLAPTKVPLRSARGLVLAEPATPGHGLHTPLGDTPIVERVAG